jgi:hypothetical protein
VDDDRLRAAVHDTVNGGGNLSFVVGSVPAEQAQRVIDQVLADYVAELNRALASGDRRMYGVDAANFMRQYAILWSLKQTL